MQYKLRFLIPAALTLVLSACGGSGGTETHSKNLSSLTIYPSHSQTPAEQLEVHQGMSQDLRTIAHYTDPEYYPDEDVTQHVKWLQSAPENFEQSQGHFLAKAFPGAETDINVVMDGVSSQHVQLLVIPGTLTKLEVIAEEANDDLVVPRGQSIILSALATFEGDDGQNHVYDVSSDALWTLSNPEEFVVEGNTFRAIGKAGSDISASLVGSYDTSSEARKLTITNGELTGIHIKLEDNQSHTVAKGYSISLHVYGTFKGSTALRNFEQDITEESYVKYLGGNGSFSHNRNVYHANGEPGSVETISVRALDEYSYHEFSDEITLTVGNPVLDDLIITERLELGDSIPLAQSREFIATGHFGSDYGEDFNQLVTDDVSWTTNEPFVLSQKENIFFAETTGRAVVTATDNNAKVSAHYNTEAIKFSDSAENNGNTFFHPVTKEEAEVEGMDDGVYKPVPTVEWALLTWSDANIYCSLKGFKLATVDQLISLSHGYDKYENINYANGWPILKRYWTHNLANGNQHFAYNMGGNADYDKEDNDTPLLAICIQHSGD